MLPGGARPPRRIKSDLENALAAFLSGAEDGAATVNCRGGVPDDEAVGSRLRVPRLQSHCS